MSTIQILTKNLIKGGRKMRTFVFGERTKDGEYAYKPTTFKTTYPEERPRFHDWCEELRVSCLHGKKSVHL